AGKPSDEPRRGCEVSRRANLVRSPIVAGTNAVELHAGREMRNLEDDRQKPAEDEMKDDEGRYRPGKRQYQERREDDQQEVEALAGKQFAWVSLVQTDRVPLVQTAVRQTMEVLPE